MSPGVRPVPFLTRLDEIHDITLSRRVPIRLPVVCGRLVGHIQKGTSSWVQIEAAVVSPNHSSSRSPAQLRWRATQKCLDRADPSERGFAAYDTRRTRSPASTGSNWATSVESSIADVLARPRLTASRTASK